HWGVSNLDEDDLEELGPALKNCVADQVLYNLENRGIEFDLLPFCRARGMPVMAYTPLSQAGRMLRDKALGEVARRHGATPAQVALAWTLRDPGVISIPKASKPEHVRLNAAARDIALTAEDRAALDAAFPPPRRKRGLAML
ncbi:MAG TPA: aldo/keto reductase, partial [Acetobacteraceae bacterium]|nr:aldo/keto reductase [Acetobacteraceae bacterium]